MYNMDSTHSFIATISRENDWHFSLTLLKTIHYVKLQRELLNYMQLHALQILRNKCCLPCIKLD